MCIIFIDYLNVMKTSETSPNNPFDGLFRIYAKKKKWTYRLNNKHFSKKIKSLYFLAASKKVTYDNWNIYISRIKKKKNPAIFANTNELVGDFNLKRNCPKT